MVVHESDVSNIYLQQTKKKFLVGSQGIFPILIGSELQDALENFRITFFVVQCVLLLLLSRMFPKVSANFGGF